MHRFNWWSELRDLFEFVVGVFPFYSRAAAVCQGENMPHWVITQPSLCQRVCWCVYNFLNWFDTLALNCHDKALFSGPPTSMQAIITCSHHRPGSHRARLSTLRAHTVSTVSAHTLRWFSHGFSLSNTAPLHYIYSVINYSIRAHAYNSAIHLKASN